MSRVDVCLGDRRYPVLIGEGGRERDLPRLVHRQARRGGRVFVIFDAQVCALYGPELVARLADSGGSIHQMVLPSGERFKTLSVAAAVYDFLLRRRVARDDFLLAVGGGVTTDLAGYTAATILRGIPWGAVPTTLLGMVDAAIGGKTGVNHPLGKNLIGAFWQPRFVLCDVGFLPTLPDRELVAGLGEVCAGGFDSLEGCGHPASAWPMRASSRSRRRRCRSASSIQPRASASSARARVSTRWAASTAMEAVSVRKLGQCSQMLA